MAQPYVTGPCHLFVGAQVTVSGGNQLVSTGSLPTTVPTQSPLTTQVPVYLGTCEKSPRVRTERGWVPLMNDITGQTLPYDRSYQGNEAVVMASLTRWNDGTLRQLKAVTNLTLAGLEGAGEIGTLMLTEGLAYNFWITFPYGGGGLTPKPAYATLLPGRRYLAAFLEGPDDEDRMGTDPKVETLVWRCMRVFNPVTGSNQLYDANMAGISTSALN